MGKKRLRKKLVSAGKHSSSTKGVLRAIRADRDHFDRLEGISRAWKAEKNPWITIENPNKSQTNMPFIRVRTNDYWGPPVYKDR